MGTILLHNAAVRGRSERLALLLERRISGVAWYTGRGFDKIRLTDYRWTPDHPFPIRFLAANERHAFVGSARFREILFCQAVSSSAAGGWVRRRRPLKGTVRPRAKRSSMRDESRTNWFWICESRNHVSSSVQEKLCARTTGNARAYPSNNRGTWHADTASRPLIATAKDRKTGSALSRHPRFRR
jgi:hypothetical protein